MAREIKKVKQVTVVFDDEEERVFEGNITFRLYPDYGQITWKAM